MTTAPRQITDRYLTGTRLRLRLVDYRGSQAVLAEAEFTTDSQAPCFRPPACSLAEVIDDPRFTGGRLARTQRNELVAWLTEYGITPQPG
jgi:hypothetical protein